MTDLPEAADWQQQLENEARRMAEEAELAESCRIADYADYHIKREQIAPAYNTATDTAPDGRNIASWNRRIIAPQQEMIADLNRKARERRK